MQSVRVRRTGKRLDQCFLFMYAYGSNMPFDIVRMNSESVAALKIIQMIHFQTSNEFVVCE